MNDEILLADLLSQWQRGQAAGRDVPAVELCANRPDLIPELARRIDIARGLMRDRGTDAGTVAPGAADSRRDELIASTLHFPERAGPVRGHAAPGYEVLGELGRGGMGVSSSANPISTT